MYHTRLWLLLLFLRTCDRSKKSDHHVLVGIPLQHHHLADVQLLFPVKPALLESFISQYLDHLIKWNIGDYRWNIIGHQDQILLDVKLSSWISSVNWKVSIIWHYWLHRRLHFSLACFEKSISEPILILSCRQSATCFSSIFHTISAFISVEIDDIAWDSLFALVL